MSRETHARVVGPGIKALRSTPSSMTLRACISVLTLAGLILLLAGVPFAYAQTGETGSVPVTPDQPTGTALWMGMMDVEWNEAPGAETYEVQYFHMTSDWADLPGNGIRIAFYGAGAVVSGLSPSSAYTFRVRAVNSHGESGWSDFGWVPQTDGPRAWVDVPEPTNVPATGKPKFNGSLTVGELLTADTSSISDENGLDRVKFYYQWISSDGTTDTDIAGATESSFSLTDADVGKTIKLRLSFIDRHGFPESLTNTAKSNQIATGAPTINGEAWVGETLTADTLDIQDEDGLTDVEYEYQWVSVGKNANKNIEGATNATYILTEAYLGKVIRVRVTFTDDEGVEETLISEAMPKVTWRPNPATGAPTIRGIPVPGETLTAETSDIRDEDGLDNASYSYQWMIVDGTAETDIAGATSTTLALVSEHLNKAFKVRVSFTDDRGYEESLTSAATKAVICPNRPTPTDVAVTAVPIVVASTTADYFVLYASFEVDSTTVEYPLLVKKGEDGTTTLAENVAALPADRYRVEKYAVSAPADVDGDCTDDITELNNLGAMNPVNPAPHVASSAVVIPDFETFDRLSFDYASGRSIIKFLMIGLDSDQPQMYFMDTVRNRFHRTFISTLGAEWVDAARGSFVYDPGLVATDGSLGVYRYRLPLLSESFSFMERVHTLLAANVPLLDDNLALRISNQELPVFRDDLSLYRESRISIVFDDDIYGETDFLALNQAAGYGLLRELDADERPLIPATW